MKIGLLVENANQVIDRVHDSIFIDAEVTDENWERFIRNNLDSFEYFPDELKKKIKESVK